MRTYFILAIVLHVPFLAMCHTVLFPHLLKHVVENRVKRQAGYVYDKPNISFDLPTRPPSTVSTQAPTVDRPQEQQMYYAYPVPAGGDTVNIGYSSPGTSSTTAATTSGVTTATNSGGGGYNYGSQNIASTSGTSGSGSNAGYNYGSQNTASTSISSDSGLNAGYNYNTPTSTSRTTTTASTVSQTVSSTNAPKYLPPKSDVASTGGGVSVNAPTGGSTIVPSGSVSTTAQTSSGGVSVPNTDYLPPLPNQPSPGPSLLIPSSPPTDVYLPPSGSTTSPIPTPAATYLPPVL